MKSTFFERAIAYLIDSLVISIIVSVICLGLPSTTNEAEEKISALEEQLQSGEISTSEYLDSYMDSSLQYEYQKSQIITSGVVTAVSIAYFIIFQYMNKGQTLGKKLLKLRVVDQNTNKPISIKKGIIRSLFIVNIASNLLNIIYIYTLNKNIYFSIYLITSSIESLFILITIIFILYKKDGLGLHDMIVNSKVIKERG